MLKILEQDFFKCSIDSIKNHKFLKNLNLTDEEIIKERENIKFVLDSCEACSDSKDYCFTVKNHYSLNRNLDNKLVIKTFKCPKIKDYQKINNQEIDHNLKKYIHLYNKTNLLKSNEIKKYINLVIEKNIFSDLQYMRELIKGVGSPKKIRNSCIHFKKNIFLERIYLIYAYKYALNQQNTIIINSEDLKQITIKKYSYFDKEERRLDNEEKWNYIREIENLIILDFGLENYSVKSSYYLDALPNLLKERNDNSKTTHIFSPINLKTIKASINLIKNKESIEAIKFEIFENILKKNFFIYEETE